ncbi:MAG: S41 family peptidase, partial [Gemmatimonadales bacterium]
RATRSITILKTLPVAVMAIGVVACASSVQSTSRNRDAALPRGLALATFDSIWSKVSQTYVDTAFVSNRWMRVRYSLRPKAAATLRRSDLDALMKETLATIPDSHFYIIPASIAGDEPQSSSADGRGTTGVSLRMLGDHVVIWRVEPGSPGAVAGLVPGQVVSRVGKKQVDREILKMKAMPEKARQRALADLLHGLNSPLSPAVGDTVAIELVNPRMIKSLVGIPAPGLVSQFGNLPPIAGLVRVAKMPSPGGSDCIGVIAFNIWLPALGKDLERAVDSVRTCSGVVIDLRGNPGGVGAMVMGFGGYFVDSTLSLGTMRTRQVTLRFAINPRRSRDDGSQRAPYAGPLAILVDPMTASTSEIFATGMQRIGRARVFGERSAGAALPALMERLPSGDVFVHAVADFTDPDGKRVEGAGVVPDEIVLLSDEALKNGRDTALEAAMRWITTCSAHGPSSSH